MMVAGAEIGSTCHDVDDGGQGQAKEDVRPDTDDGCRSRHRKG
ncbi:hypothetical protein [Faecalibaculum rodentium]|nr:hypothetical protein [Faecalibaculum rodentium]